jgi:3-carboxy-cis,cis-muconate cycloisomerase
MSVNPFEGMLASPAMVALFDDNAIIDAMFRFEAALARAQAEAGLIPREAAGAITGVCKAELYDTAEIVSASRRAGSLAIPVVKKLTETVGLFDAEAAGYVHWGSTSQDVIDTAMVLQTRRAVGLIDASLQALIGHLLALAERHEQTPMLGRTLMQPAVPVSFGFKVIAWVAPLVRARARLAAAARAGLQLQLGGAVGTLSSMGDKADEVVSRVAAELELAVAPSAWHTQRDSWAVLGCEVGVLCGSLGKIGRDLSLMVQAEVGELAEPSGKGRGGSSAMPHKRNPVSSMIALSASFRAPQRVATLLATMAQEHERGLGDWQAELADWPGLFIAAHGALLALEEAMGGLEVDAARMLKNIDALNGLVYAEGASLALAEAIGRKEAFALLETLSRQVVTSGRHLRELVIEAVEADAALKSRFALERIESWFDARLAVSAAARITRQNLAALRASA